MADWASIFKDTIIPAAGAIIPQVLANRAQAAGIGASKEDLERAYQMSQGSIAGATAAAQPYAQWQLGQNTGNLGTAYGNALTNAQWGLDASTGLRQQGLNNALATGQQGFNAAQGALSPYAQLGNNALAQLSSHLLGPQGAIPQQQWKQPSFNLPQMNLSVGQLPKQNPLTGSQLPQFDMSANSLAGGAGGVGGLTGAPDASGSNLAARSAQTQGVRSDAGGLIGTGLGIAASVIPLLGFIPFVGPILAGVGALIGTLWNNHGADKTWASNAINDVGLAVWGPKRDGNGGLIQEVKDGKLTAEQAKTTYQALWQGWIRAMQNAGVDEGTIQKSIESQQKYWATTPQIIDQAAASAPKQMSGTPGTQAPPVGGERYV